MYCSQCGKKVNDTMLFCPFCGSALVLPEQEEKEGAPKEPAENAEAVREDEFRPLDLDAFPESENSHARTHAEREAPQRQPVRLEGNVPDLSNIHAPVQAKRAKKKRPSTYAPQKAFNPDDIFLDAKDNDFESSDDEDTFTYEEPVGGGFFERHMRGMVGLMAFAVLLIVLLLWALSSPGQRTLANVNLAWRAEAYEQIAYEAYQNQNYTLSAQYYLKALARDPESYDYAYSAGVMYLWNSDAANAAEMAKRAIQIDPTRADAYLLLLRAYPDASTRPWEVQSLIEQGYQQTGNESLNAAL